MRCPPPLVLERVLDRSLQSSQSAHWGAHIESCATCQAALGHMRDLGAAYMQSDQAERLRRMLSAAPTERPFRPMRRLVPLVASAVAVLVCLMVWGPDFLRLPAPDLTAKGAAHLWLTTSRDGGPATLWEGSALTAADALQAVWSSPHDGYLAVSLREPTGTLVQIRGAMPERRGGARAVGPSFRLDEPDGHQLLGWFSESPFQAPTEPGFSGQVFTVPLK